MLPNLGRPSKQNARAHTHTEALTDPHSIDRRAARLSTRRQFTHKRCAHAAAAAQPAAWLVFINCSVYFASAVACQLTETIKLIDINNCCCCSFVSISSRFVSFQFVPFRSVSSQVLRLCARARAPAPTSTSSSLAPSSSSAAACSRLNSSTWKCRHNNNNSAGSGNSIRQLNSGDTTTCHAMLGWLAGGCQFRQL